MKPIKHFLCFGLTIICINVYSLKELYLDVNTNSIEHDGTITKPFINILDAFDLIK